MKGMISWFAKNSVAANLLMVFIVVSGAISIISINSEVFPAIDLEMISIEVPYLHSANFDHLRVSTVPLTAIPTACLWPTDLPRTR